jgi:excinuclease ABC subunit A
MNEIRNNVIEVIGAKENNLKNISLTIPKDKFVVITGLSGSGKSSLAFDTLYAEGHRRYIESLSAYARQFLHMHNKPDVESIHGLSPAIAIDQKGASKNPRSTVGTITEIYDYLRLLYARIGIAYSPATGQPIQKQSASQITSQVQTLPVDTKVHILAPIARNVKGEHQKEMVRLRKQGFQRVKIDGIIHDLGDLPTIDKNKKHVIDLIVDRITISDDMGNRLAESIETALKHGQGIVKVEIVDTENPQAELIFSEKFACPVSGFQLDEIEPRTFSFNSPFGACQVCEGLGIEKFLDVNLIVPNKKLSINDGALVPLKHLKTRDTLDTLTALAKHFQFNLDWPFEKLSSEIQDIILYGSEQPLDVHVNSGLFSRTVQKVFEGVIPILKKTLQQFSGEYWAHELTRKFEAQRPCSSCHGYKLKPGALCVKIDNKHIGEVCEMTIQESFDWFEALPQHLSETHNSISDKIIKEIKNRLKFLLNVGLDYLSLSRQASTLSGGENQRIRLASQIGSGLCGVLYVLDEPSIGLHQSDNEKLINSLISLSKIGNSVIVVEHDEETMMAADHLIDIGPGAGVHGGRLIAEGTPKQVMENPNSITGQYLSGKKYIAIPKEYRKGHPNKTLKLSGASLNNLKDVSIEIPLGTFTCVTGVSGGGKSSLIIDTLYRAGLLALGLSSDIPGPYTKLEGVEYIDKIIEIDQSPIGRTPRSNPATYTGVFDPIRDWFTNLPESKARGYKAGRFSFNIKGGRCESCQGDGLLKIEMHFLPDVYIACEECKGARYNKETLEVKYKDKSISDILQMTAEDAREFFKTIPAIREKLDAINDVGLGYIKIGQSATTLSGGEAQRVKLAKELSRHSTGRTLYILDEPTTGLHIDDISKLLKVLQRLVDKGNTVLVIEHNMEVIKTADHVIDVGPGGGNRGGRIVATGTPHDIAKCDESLTGKYLKHYLYKVVKEMA